MDLNKEDQETMNEGLRILARIIARDVIKKRTDARKNEKLRDSENKGPINYQI